MSPNAQNPAQRSYRYLTVSIPFITIFFVLIVLGMLVWHQYSSTLMQNQTEQLQLVTKSLGQSIEFSMREYDDSVDFLANNAENASENLSFFTDYLDAQTNRTADIRWEDSNGNCLRSVRGLELYCDVCITGEGDSSSIWQYHDNNELHYLVFKQTLSNGQQFCMVVDEESFYSDLISDIHVGTNGYVVVKNSEGLIISHPSRQQWGIDVIEGRKELFPNLDFDSLSDMVAQQNAEESGIYQYYSYWWTNPDLPRVQKISAHVHAHVLNDFWVVSAVVDYSDLYSPIVSGYQRIILVFIGILFLFLTLAFCIMKLQLDKQKNALEIKYLRDLTEALEELRLSEENLAHQQRLQVIGTMTGGLAHEFNNFLTPIEGFAELIMDESDPESETYDNAHEISLAAERAREVILQISSMSRKNVETVYTPFAVSAFLLRSIRMMDSIRPQSVRFDSKINLSEHAMVLGNKTQLHQVLLNLCMNALHAMGTGGGTLTIVANCVSPETAQQFCPKERVSRQWNCYIQIDVTDTGCGMESGTLQHIFEPFYTTKPSGQGTGLGLSLADQIIHAHKGYIAVESTVGQGSTFHLFLPLLEQKSSVEPLQWGQNQQLQLIIADDNRKVLELLKKDLEPLGITSTVCTSFKELNELLSSTPASVLVLDESLSDGDAVSFCMSIQEKYPNLLKIIMADNVTREIIEARQRQVISGYLCKPVAASTLLAVIRDCGREQG